MNKIIAVAGATGHLGEQIVLSLLKQSATVHAIVRPGSQEATVSRLKNAGAVIFVINNWQKDELKITCNGAACVVSVLAGLEDVVIDAQKILLDAAIAAGVSRFIPSDYSLDFTKFSDGENRNLDLRRRFHQYLDQQPIKATSIFNGAFAYLLLGDMPLILEKPKLILYWGDRDHKMAFTTTANTAEFTAHAAMDESTPRYLHIAGDEVSPSQIQKIASEVMGKKFKFLPAGGQGVLGFMIKMAKFFSPGKNDLYPAWQGMQYMHNMIDERADMPPLDNDRYPSISWTSVKDVLEEGENLKS